MPHRGIFALIHVKSGGFFLFAVEVEFRLKTRSRRLPQFTSSAILGKRTSEVRFGMPKLRVIVVGGFLGAGKTTLLAQAARYFTTRGKKVGIITNDQAADLVDTHLLSGLGIAVAEVAGGCFCCRFEDFERTANNLFQSVQPDVLLAEPVGSCTDISATVLQPMKQQWGGWIELSPFSVLADPRLLRQIFDARPSSFPDSVRYIMRQQFEEADSLVINKVDLVSPEELSSMKAEIESAWPGIKTHEMSALENSGVAEWLDAISGFSNGGRKILDVDYDTYARGEAELGWLNTSMSLVARKETDWEGFARELICRIQQSLASHRAEIGHLKLLISNQDGQVVANVTSIRDVPSVQSGIGASAGAASLIVNARALVEPELLKSIVEASIRAMEEASIEVSESSLQSFKPAYPQPTHRFDRVVVQS
jgi:G3E family GTPase